MYIHNPINIYKLKLLILRAKIFAVLILGGFFLNEVHSQSNRDSLRQITTASNSAENIGNAYLSLAKSYFRLNYDSTVYYLHHAKPFLIQTKDRPNQAELNSLMARSQWNLNQYDSAIINNNEALNIYKELQDTLNQAICNQRIGGSWLAIDMYDSAAVYYYKAKELFVLLDDKFGTIANAIELGVLQKRIWEL